MLLVLREKPVMYIQYVSSLVRERHESHGLEGCDLRQSNLGFGLSNTNSPSSSSALRK